MVTSFRFCRAPCKALLIVLLENSQFWYSLPSKQSDDNVQIYHQSYIKHDSINNLQLPYLHIIDPLNHTEVLFHLNNSLSVIIDLTHHEKLGQHHTLRIYCVKNTMRSARSTRISRIQFLVLRSSRIPSYDRLVNQ